MDVVIVGGALAGLRSAEALRASGFDGRLTMVGAEDHEPYDRPPLSKGILTGEVTAASLALCGPGGLAELGVDFLPGVRASRLDPSHRVVELDGHGMLPFDELIVATGARARLLPGTDVLGGVHELRTIEDAMAIREALGHAAAVVVIGGGFIGSEVASAVRQRGLDVTVLEANSAPLNRVLSPVIGARLGAMHAEAGSVLRCDARVERLIGAEHVEGVRLRDGSIIAADLVVVGVGSVANTDWLIGSGLDVHSGVRCDGTGRSFGVPHVHAVGDVARWESARYGDTVRTEHWTSAGDQAQVVAADLLGHALPPESVPYVWSDQFGRRLQIGGRCRADDEVLVVHDDGGQYLALTGRHGYLTSVVAVDDPRSFGRFRRLIARSATWEAAAVEAHKDPSGGIRT